LLYGAIEKLTSIDESVADEVIVDYHKEVAEGFAVGRAKLAAAVASPARSGGGVAGSNGLEDLSGRLERIEQLLTQHERAIRALLTSAISVASALPANDAKGVASDEDELGASS